MGGSRGQTRFCRPRFRCESRTSGAYLRLIRDTLHNVRNVATAGYYLALRVGFAYPQEEVNELPVEWVEFYTQNCFMLHDPVIRWVYAHTGAVRWRDIPFEDPKKVLFAARGFGLCYGVAVSCYDDSLGSERSYGSFARKDRDFSDTEIAGLAAVVRDLHHKPVSDVTITEAEREALAMVKAGMRVKEIAHLFGVSDGAIKQRLSNAKRKLDAKTGAQAAARASDLGLI